MDGCSGKFIDGEPQLSLETYGSQQPQWIGGKALRRDHADQAAVEVSQAVVGVDKRRGVPRAGKAAQRDCKRVNGEVPSSQILEHVTVQRRAVYLTDALIHIPQHHPAGAKALP